MKTIHRSLNKYQHFTPIDCVEYTNSVVADILGNIKQSETKNTRLLLSVYFEADLKILLPIFDIINNLHFKEVHLLVDPWCTPAKLEKHLALFDSVNIINFYAICAHVNYHGSNLSKLHTKIKSHKGLVLTGKLFKCNRINLLKLLYDKNLLTQDNFLWTIPNIEDICDQKTNFNEDFLKVCVDQRYIETSPNEGKLFSRFSVFDETAFSIIPETKFSSKYELCVTEKTYRAILHKHPFIIASSPGSLSWLSSLGFETFANYLPIPDYDTITAPDLRLKSIVENATAMQALIENDPHIFDQEVNHNTETLKRIGKNELNKLKKIYHRFGLDNTNLIRSFELDWDTLILNNFHPNNTIQSFFPCVPNYTTMCLSDRTKNWIDRYNQIKGADWPAISSREEFSSLPQWIQDECKTEFNFSDKSHL